MNTEFEDRTVQTPSRGANSDAAELAAAGGRWPARAAPSTISMATRLALRERGLIEAEEAA
jgi:hypothetical protein